MERELSQNDDQLLLEYEEDCPDCGGMETVVVERYEDKEGEIYEIRNVCRVCMNGGNV